MAINIPVSSDDEFVSVLRLILQNTIPPDTWDHDIFIIINKDDK